MKDNLLELLMNLFETSLSALQKTQKAILDNLQATDSEEKIVTTEDQACEIKYFKSPKEGSLRVFTSLEQSKLTKASYQFLKRMRLWCVIDADILELVMNQLIFSESFIVTLEETKWTIRNIMANLLQEDQMAFLDLILNDEKELMKAH